jgi:hypothetical protein
MINLSDTNLISSKEKAITFGCEQLGFSRKIVNQMFESAKNLEGEKFTTELFISKINDVTKPKEIVTSGEFITSIATLFGEVATSNNKINYAEKFLTILNDFDNQSKIDSIGLINIANDVIGIKDLRNPIGFEKNLGLLYDNPVQLFEGLKNILGKNNSRWGSTYHIQNVYQKIMSELTKEVEDIQMSQKIYSVNNDYHLIIINDMLSGNCSPLHKHVSSVKELVPNMQSLLFDMVLLVGRYVDENDTALKYISRQTVNEFIESGNYIVNKLISSVGDSNLLNTKGQKFDINSGEHKHNSVFLHLVCSIMDSNLKHGINNMSLKGIFDMLHFIATCSTDMPLSVRSYIRTFVAKGLEMTSKVERANFLLMKQTNAKF